MIRDKVLEAMTAVLGEDGFLQSEDFIEDGWLDSMEIVELVSELEDIFDIEFRGGDIIPENFVSLETITQLLENYVEEG